MMEEEEEEQELVTRGASKRARAGSSVSAEAAAEADRVAKQVEADAALAAALTDPAPPPKKKRASGKRKPAAVRRAEEEAAAAALAANGGVPLEETPLDDSCFKCQESHSYPGNELILCDGDDCGSMYHLHCLRPKLLTVPKGDWCVAPPRSPGGGNQRRLLCPSCGGVASRPPHPAPPSPLSLDRRGHAAQVLPLVLVAAARPRQAGGGQLDRQDSRRPPARPARARRRRSLCRQRRGPRGCGGGRGLAGSGERAQAPRQYAERLGRARVPLQV